MVASENGYLYVYSIPTEGGECQLIKRHDLKSADQAANLPLIRPQGKGIY